MALVFDIETIGEDFDSLDETTQGVLTRWIEKESSSDEEYRILLDDLKDGLGFSPLTGEVVAIGVYDTEHEKGVVYFQPGSAEVVEDIQEGDFVLKPCSEKEMLDRFWKGALKYTEFVTFNGRQFDVPFLMVRSAIHGIRPTKDLMRHRYLTSQPYNAQHIDLQDQLSFYGALRRKGALHLWCRAFGIESPKAAGVSGDDVSQLFQEGKTIDIAKYNVRDVISTTELYEVWREKLQF